MIALKHICVQGITYQLPIKTHFKLKIQSFRCNNWTRRSLHSPANFRATQSLEYVDDAWPWNVELNRRIAHLRTISGDLPPTSRLLLEPTAGRAKLQTIHDPFLIDNGVSLVIKREDLLHPEISGNKWRKLKYTLLEAFANGDNVRTLRPFSVAYISHAPLPHPSSLPAPSPSSSYPCPARMSHFLHLPQKCLFLSQPARQPPVSERREREV